MQELSRVFLYRMILNQLEERTQNTWEYQNEISSIVEVLKTNIYMLNGIEDQFLLGRQIDYITEENLKRELQTKVENLQDENFRKFLMRQGRKVPNRNSFQLTFWEYLYQEEKHWDAITIFSKLLDELYEYSDKQIKKIDRRSFTDILEYLYVYPEIRTKVFLSYAYKDKLYSWALYHYMRANQVYLYIDWMHSEAKENGAKIKVSLQRALSDSEQFLFLRTANSELGKNDTKQIRSWCSWEFLWSKPKRSLKSCR